MEMSPQAVERILALHNQAEAHYARVSQALDTMVGDNDPVSLRRQSDLYDQCREQAGARQALHEVLLILGIDPNQDPDEWMEG